MTPLGVAPPSDLLKSIHDSLRSIGEGGDWATATFAMNGTGGVMLLKGEASTAREALEEAVEWGRRSGDPGIEAAARINLGAADAARGAFGEALASTQAALVGFDASANLPAASPADPRAQAARTGRELALVNLAALEAHVGRYAEAFQHLRTALAMHPATDSPAGAAPILRGMAATTMQLGRAAEARRLVDRAERARRAGPAPFEIENPQGGTGHVALSDASVAPLAVGVLAPPESPRSKPKPAVLSDDVKASILAQEKEMAATMRSQYLDAARSAAGAAPAGSTETAPSPITPMAALAALGPASLLRSPFSRPGPTAPLPDAAREQARFVDEAMRGEGQGDFAAALSGWRRAAAVAVAVDSADGRLTAWSSLQRLAAARGAPALSIYYGKRAAEEARAQRHLQSEMDRDELRALAGRTRGIVESLAGALLDAGRLAEAERVLAMLNSEDESDAPLPFDAAERSLLDHETDLEARWRANLADRLALMHSNPTISVKPPDSSRLASLGAVPQHFRDPAADQRLAVLDHDFRDLQAEAGRIAPAQVEEQLGRAPAFPADEQRRLDATVDGLKALAGTVQVRYLTTERQLRILVVSGQGRQARSVEIGRAQLEAAVQNYRKVLADPGSDPREPARALHASLIQPILEDLTRERAQTLVLAPDGPLRYLPFAALSDGNQWLVERFALSIDASSSAVSRAPRSNSALPPPPWHVAGFGTTRAVDGLVALPAVAQELQDVVRENGVSTGGAIDGIALLDGEFTADALRDALRQRYPVVHIASHFMLMRREEGDSFLVLGDGGRLTLPELRGDFRFDGVELLTLSACNTALDIRDSYGQEFEGIGAMLRNQGAAAVIATLWSVNDASTGLFMQRFYREHERAHLSRAEALRLAQLFFLADSRASQGQPRRRGVDVVDVQISAPGGAGASAPAREQLALAGRYAHPYYWAPFTLFGDWW